MLQNLKALLGLALVGGAIYVGAMVLPHYFAFYKFKDDVASAAKFGSASDKSETVIRDEVLAKAVEYDLSVKESDIHVIRNDKDISINVRYQEVVEFVGGKKIILKYDASTTNKPKPTPGR